MEHKEDTVEEVWAEIPNYEGYYEVSNMGRVRSLDRYVTRYSQKMFIKGKLLSICINRTSRPYVQFYKLSKFKNYEVHQLVCMAFLGHDPKHSNLVVDHINNDKLDNRLCNLQVITKRLNLSKDRKRKDSRNKFTGVSLNPINGRWRAKIVTNNISRSLGSFATEEEAYNTYIEAVRLFEENGDVTFTGGKKLKKNKYKFISFIKRTGKWGVRITINGFYKSLGSFETEEAAFEYLTKYKKENGIA